MKKKTETKFLKTLKAIYRYKFSPKTEFYIRLLDIVAILFIINMSIFIIPNYEYLILPKGSTEFFDIREDMGYEPLYTFYYKGIPIHLYTPYDEHRITKMLSFVNDEDLEELSSINFGVWRSDTNICGYYNRFNKNIYFNANTTFCYYQEFILYHEIGHHVLDSNQTNADEYAVKVMERFPYFQNKRIEIEIHENVYWSLRVVDDNGFRDLLMPERWWE